MKSIIFLLLIVPVLVFSQVNDQDAICFEYTDNHSETFVSDSNWFLDSDSIGSFTLGNGLPDYSYVYHPQYISFSWDSLYLDFYVEDDSLFISTNGKMGEASVKFLEYFMEYVSWGCDSIQYTKLIDNQ